MLFCPHVSVPQVAEVREGRQSTLKVAWSTLLEFPKDCRHIAALRSLVAALRSEAFHGDERPLDGAPRVNRSTGPLAVIRDQPKSREALVGDLRSAEAHGVSVQLP